jgi:hypothetical protein
MDFDGFAANDQAVYASLHALLIVSEAARKLGVAAESLILPSHGRQSEASATSCATNMMVSIRALYGALSQAAILCLRTEVLTGCPSGLPGSPALIIWFR